MAIGRISGPMLFNNLERQGVDLAFQSNLLYLDVNNLRVGIQNSAPNYVLDTPGNVKLANLIILGNKLTSNIGIVDLGSTANITISGGSANYVLYTDGSGNLNWGEISSLDASWGNLVFANNTITVTNTNGNLVLLANGTGSVTTANNFYAGNVYATNLTGNITSNGAVFSGNISSPWFIGNVSATTVNSINENITYGNAAVYYIADLNSTNGNITTLAVTNFSTSNVVISGGNISGLTNVSSQYITATTGFYSGNITGGFNQNSLTGTVPTANVSLYQELTNSTTNASFYLPFYDKATGNAAAYTNTNFTFNPNTGYLTTTRFDGNIYATDGQITNLSTGNAVITGGYFSNIANLTTTGSIVSSGNLIAASGQNATNYTTGALVVPGGGGVGITGDLWVQGPSTFAGNIVAGNILLSGNINVPVGGTFSNTGTFFGNAGGIGALYAGTATYTALPTTVLQLSGNVDTYAQVNFQNINSGTKASTDFVLTADNGNDTDGYLDLGINSSTFDDSAYPGFYPNDGYLVHHTAIPSGNLIIFSHELGSAIKFHVGEYGDANVRVTVTNSGLRVNTTTSSTSLTSGALLVDGGIGILGNIHAAAINNTPIGNTIPSTGNFTNLYSNTSVITNFSTGNVVTTGGQINNTIIGNITPSTGSFTLLDASNIFANNFSTANALITGGNLTANITGNVNGTFSNFSGNVNANWFLGNIEGSKANFSDVVFANSNLTVSGNLIASGNILAQKITSPAGDLHISAATNDPNNIIRFDSVSAIDIASGTTAQRPPSPDYGYIRYNTDQGSIEWWTGIEWFQPVQTITSEIINPDGVNNIFVLNQSTSDNAILVNINGTIQQAGAGAYSVTGNQITFAEIPSVTDIIEIRYIAGGVAASTVNFENISSNVKPSANVTYDLGSSNYRWRDLWLSGNTIHLGAANISAAGTAIDLPTGSTIGGSPIGAASYSNVDVAGYLVSYTGNIAAGNILSDNLLNSNGQPFTFGSTYSNANVSAYLTTYTGNISAGNIFLVTVANVTTPAANLEFDPNMMYLVGPSFSLSNNNTTVTALSTMSGEPSLLGTLAIQDNEKKVFSTYIDVGPAQADFLGIGIARANIDLSDYPGGTNGQSIGLYDDGVVYGENLYAGSLPFFGAGDTVDIAVDRVNDLLWIRVNGGDWNEDPGNDPATATGNAISLTNFSNSDPIYPVYGPYYAGGNADQMSIVQTSPYALPSGFTMLEQAANTSSTYSNVSIGNGNVVVDNVIVDNGIYWSNGAPYIGAPGGTTRQLQFNNNGILKGANVIFDSTNGNVVITSTTTSTSFDTGALVVGGSVGVGGNIHVGYRVYASTVANGGFFWANGEPYSTSYGSYGNANVKTYLESLSNVNIGVGTGTNQGNLSIALGPYAGNTLQKDLAIAIGSNGFYGNLLGSEGYAAGGYNQGLGTVAIGTVAGGYNQSDEAVAIGDGAGARTQGYGAVAVGPTAGQINQGQLSIALGPNAGEYDQGSAAVAVGLIAAQYRQGADAVAIGQGAGSLDQGSRSVAIGYFSGSSQGSSAIAIGEQAGYNTQGNNAIAIGYQAGYLNQAANSIVIATQRLDANTAGFFVDPVRNVTSGNVLVYDTNNKEVLRSNVNIVGQTGTPSNTSTPASWLQMQVAGVTYYMPLYQ